MCCYSQLTVIQQQSGGRTPTRGDCLLLDAGHQLRSPLRLTSLGRSITTALTGSMKELGRAWSMGLLDSTDVCLPTLQMWSATTRQRLIFGMSGDRTLQLLAFLPALFFKTDQLLKTSRGMNLQRYSLAAAQIGSSDKKPRTLLLKREGAESGFTWDA